MRKICKVRPSFDMCMGCSDVSGIIDNCVNCDLKHATYELISVGTTFFGRDYAFVQKDGKIEKVPLYRVYDIHYEEDRPVTKCSVPL